MYFAALKALRLGEAKLLIMEGIHGIGLWWGRAGVPLAG